MSEAVKRQRICGVLAESAVKGSMCEIWDCTKDAVFNVVIVNIGTDKTRYMLCMDHAYAVRSQVRTAIDVIEGKV